MTPEELIFAASIGAIVLIRIKWNEIVRRLEMKNWKEDEEDESST